jgi:hypothetical protein
LTFEEIGAAYFAAETAQARGTLFPVMLYVNLYCGRLPPENAAKPDAEQRRFQQYQT